MTVLWKKEGPKVCTSGPTLNLRFPLKMAEIEMNKQNCGKTSTIWLSKYVRIEALSSLSFLGKIRLLFALFVLFLARKKRRSQVKGLKSEYDIFFFTHRIAGQLPVKRNWFQHFLTFAAMGHKGFSSLAAFSGTTSTFLKKISRIS